MKGWFVGVGLLVLLGGSAAALWATWDSTQTSPPASLSSDMSLAVGDGVPPLTVGEPDPSAACVPGNDPVRVDPLDDWATVVVDPGHSLPADFVPPDLVSVSTAGFENTSDNVREIVVSDLAELRQAAEANGTPFIVVSAYRSFGYQQRLFDNQAALVGEDGADATTARPGHSEHQLGTTVDVLDPAASELTIDFAGTPVGRWLAEHAHEYGFVHSYPNEAREQTCYDFEPWHLRYVGRDIAEKIQRSGRTPRMWMMEDNLSVRHDR